MRISREQMFMRIAHVVAERSTCFRLNVGAVIVANNRIVSIGYNGQPAGVDHCTGMCRPGCCKTIHAEQNALDHLPLTLTPAQTREGLHMYVTDSPCAACAMEIGEANFIRRLYFQTPYRDVSALDWLAERIEVLQVLPAGHVIEWKTKKIVDAAQ